MYLASDDPVMEAYLMHSEDVRRLLDEVETEILEGRSSVGLLGLTSAAVELLGRLAARGLAGAVSGIFADKAASGPELQLAAPLRPLEELLDDHVDALVVCADAEKEDLLAEALPYIVGTPKIIVAGFGHYAFRDVEFDKLRADLLVPSIANGYDNCLIHLFQCLKNAAKLGLTGSVVEFGTYKGGTTAFLAKVARHLGQAWPVISFDTFDGFPPRRSPLDMYDNPECEFRDLTAVRQYTAQYDVELIVGDIYDTSTQLDGRDFVLSFFDTDNFSSAERALSVVRERTVVGGAIVFDHWVGTSRFRYTLGERFAARSLQADGRYFNLHGTGVFVRQR